MIGIVVVSHSAALADAAIDLAREMVPGDSPRIATAAGADGGFGTDATAVAAAIEQVGGPEGVLVLMDLGSAVLSAELALEFVPDMVVRLSPAALVEGLNAAIVVAAGGADLDRVAAEAEAALSAKQSALGETEDATRGASPAPTGVGEELQLVNPAGLHARPAGLLAAELGPLEAAVTISYNDRQADATSPISLMTLGAGEGARIRVSADGPDSDAALALIRRLVEDGFGEL